MSIEYFYDKVLDASEFYDSEYKAIVDALNEAKKMYEEEIAKAFEKGYIQGVNYTDGLISEEKKFPF
jgi:uncharacterized protein YktA (UPF0223 family)